MRRHELSQRQWERIQGFFPAPRRARGRPWKDHRAVVNGILWVLHTGAPWRDLPERFGKWKTVYDRFNRWRRGGLFDRILAALQIRLDRNGHVDWNLWCVDTTTVRAAAGGGRGP